MTSWFGQVVGHVLDSVAATAPGALAICSFTSTLVLVATTQHYRAALSNTLKSADQQKIETYTQNLPHQIKGARMSLIPPAAAASSSPTTTTTTSTTTTASTDSYPVDQPPRNFFQFKPPVRSLPNPERYLQASERDDDKTRLSPSNIAAHSASLSAAAASAADAGTGSGLVLGTGSSPSVPSPATNDNGSAYGARAAYSATKLAESLSTTTLMEKASTTPEPDTAAEGGAKNQDDESVTSEDSSRTFFSYDSTLSKYGGGVKFVSDSDSEGGDDETNSGRSSPLSPSTIFSSEWRPQFILTVPRWEYNASGDVLYTVQTTYSPSSSWCVRRTYAEFCAWKASVDKELSSLIPPLAAPFPPSEFVLFYLPVEAISARMAALDAFLVEVSHTQALIKLPPFFRALLSFIDPGPNDDQFSGEDTRGTHEIGRNGEDLMM